MAAGFDIHVHTQYRENYGDAEKPYWKFKGGETYVLTGFSHPLNDGIGKAGQAAVESVRSQIEYSNPMSEEFIIDWEFVPAGSLTPWEQDQMEFDGAIDSPSKRLPLNEVAHA